MFEKYLKNVSNENKHFNLQLFFVKFCFNFKKFDFTFLLTIDYIIKCITLTEKSGEKESLASVELEGKYLKLSSVYE